MRALLEILPLALWATLWLGGGWLLAASLFRLRHGEAAMTGLGIGLVSQVWLANLLAHGLPVMVTFWLSGVLILAIGLISVFFFRKDMRFDFSLSQWLILGFLLLLFNAIGRGLGIFDDYQNLPTISLMATGDTPPHFALNPSLNFGYHYFLLLFAAQIMRLGNMFPWSALDLGRALMLALPLVLAGIWACRLTRNRLAGFLTAFLLAFAGGARWLLLLLPSRILTSISQSITLIGSAATSAPNLAQALLSSWKIDGAGPIPFPFAFYTGINQPYIMAYTGISGSAILILLLILLTAGRWRHWTAGVVTAVLIASLAIANEIAFLLIGFGFLIAALVWAVSNRSLRLPSRLLGWMGILGGASLVAFLQGGMLTEIARARLGSVLSGVEGAGAGSYFDTSPSFVWPPSIISAHLGSLSIFNPAQLTAALAEIGPVVLVTPLILAWAWKSLRGRRWYEAALIFSSFGSLIALFVAFRGPLFTATPRLMSGWFFACILYAVPLLWIWVRRRSRSSAWEAGAVAGGLVTVLGGLVLFGVQLLAIQKPIYATFITPMDAKMSEEYWNKLTLGALVFDPDMYRAPTVFGRFTKSSPTWYTRYPEWESLLASPDPFSLRGAGFAYMYFGRDYWDGLTSEQQSALQVSCVKQIAQVDGIHSEKDYRKDFRRLLDIRECKE